MLTAIWRCLICESAALQRRLGPGLATLLCTGAPFDVLLTRSWIEVRDDTAAIVGVAQSVSDFSEDALGLHLCQCRQNGAGSVVSSAVCIEVLS